MRRLIASTVLGIVSAGALMVGSVLASFLLPDATQLILVPGEMMVRASDWICAPSGAECVLGSKRQGARHLWLLICALAAWSAMFSTAWWCGLRRVSRTRKRASIFHHERGVS